VARKPRDKKPAKKPAPKLAGERSAKTGRRGPSPLAAAVFVLIAGGAALAGWLTVSYQPMEKHGGETASNEAVMSIDLSKEGSGRQAAPEKAVLEKAAQDDHAAEKEPDGHGKPKDMAKTDGHDKPAPSKEADHKAADDGHAAKPAPTPTKTAHKAPPSPQPTPEVEDGNAHKTDADSADIDKTGAHQKADDADKHAPAKVADANDTTDASGGGHTGADNKDAAVSGTQKNVPPQHGDAKFSGLGSLTPAPDPALIKAGKNGPLPIVAADGRTPLQVYARPYKSTGRPRIAIVVGSLGLSQATTLAAIQQLPGGVTLAFAPYGRNLQDYVNQARAAGHEVMLQVPMEPMDYPTNDPGPHTLLTSLTIHRNLQRLDWLLGRFTGYVGVVNFMGGRFTAADTHLSPVLEAMRDRGLMFLDARASSTSVAKDVAGQIGLYVAANDRVLDAIASRSAIDARLLELERLANASGGAVGIGFPYPVTIERLAQWTRAMGDRGFDLVPISALTDHQTKAKN